MFELYNPITPNEGPLFKDINYYLTKLEQYEEKLKKQSQDPLTVQKINCISSFIADTRKRTKEFESGKSDSFDGYIDSNKERLLILAKPRVTRPILYSVLLSLLGVPFLCGVIQLALTKGNTYLLLSRVTKSEQRALDLQQAVIKQTNKSSISNNDDQSKRNKKYHSSIKLHNTPP